MRTEFSDIELKLADKLQQLEDAIGNEQYLEEVLDAIVEYKRLSANQRAREKALLRFNLRQERLQRQKVERDRARFMFVVLVFMCGMAEYRALLLCQIADFAFSPETY